MAVGLNAMGQSDVTEQELTEHVTFLASPKMAGRFPGTKENKRVVRYLVKNFKRAGIKTVGKSYLQNFEARIRVKKGVIDTPVVETQNVIGFIEGTDPVLKHEFIVLGAHYDHLGMGGPSSKNRIRLAFTWVLMTMQAEQLLCWRLARCWQQTGKI